MHHFRCQAFSSRVNVGRDLLTTFSQNKTPVELIRGNTEYVRSNHMMSSVYYLPSGSEAWSSW
jgi:hypothetical protein